jgi:hypothetical protein
VSRRWNVRRIWVICCAHDGSILHSNLQQSQQGFMSAVSNRSVFLVQGRTTHFIAKQTADKEKKL